MPSQSRRQITLAVESEDASTADFQSFEATSGETLVVTTRVCKRGLDESPEPGVARLGGRDEDIARLDGEQSGVEDPDIARLQRQRSHVDEDVARLTGRQAHTVENICNTPSKFSPGLSLC